MRGSTVLRSRNYTDLVWGGKKKKIQSKQTRKSLGVNPLTWTEWWQTWLKEMTNDSRKSERTITLWHTRESSKSDNSRGAERNAWPHVSVCVRHHRLLCCQEICWEFSASETKTRSAASPVISQHPVTAGSAFRTSPYPILHLFRSAPTYQQSNFTQAGSDWGKH